MQDTPEMQVWSSLVWKRCPGGGNGTQLQYPCRGDPIGRGAWPATVHGVTRVRHDLAPHHHHHSSPELFYLAELKLHTREILTPCGPFSPTPGSYHHTFCL